MITASLRHSTNRRALSVHKTLLRGMASQSQQHTSIKKSQPRASWLHAAAAMGLSVATAATATLLDSQKARYPQPAQMVPSDTPAKIQENQRLNRPPPRPDLPIYSREEVAEHCDEDSLWYTFRGGVYDLTQFYQGHPGGAPVRFVARREMFPDCTLLLTYILV